MELPMEKLIKHLDPIHQGIRILAEKLLEEEKELVKKAYADSKKRDNEYITSSEYLNKILQND